MRIEAAGQARTSSVPLLPNAADMRWKNVVAERKEILGHGAVLMSYKSAVRVQRTYRH
jgi:hypothetical protein